MSILCPLCGLRSVNLSAYDIHECRTHDQIRAESAALREALLRLLARIDSEPTMSGHLRGMRLRQDHGDSHAHQRRDSGRQGNADH